MGEDFMLKRNRQFRRCRDAAFERELAKPDLFSSCMPELQRQIFGFLEDDCRLMVGDKLCPGPDSSSDRIVYVRGNARAVRLEKESASVVMALAKDCGAPLTARVASVQEEIGLVELELMKPNFSNRSRSVE